MNNELIDEFCKVYADNVASVLKNEADHRLAVERFRNWFKNLTQEQRDELKTLKTQIEEHVSRTKAITDVFSHEIPYLFM